MILVDSSVWVDHLRKGNATLAHMLDHKRVLAHPFVVGELALGSLTQRKAILAALQDLPQAIVASETEVLRFIGREALIVNKRATGRIKDLADVEALQGPSQ